MSGKLAIDGGVPVAKEPINWEHSGVLGEEEAVAAYNVLKSGKIWLYSSDNDIEKFEEEFARYIGVKHAISFFNCTCGIEAALAAAKIGAGDEVITSPFTMAATYMSIVRQAGIPVFGDIDARTYALSPESVKEHITERTKAILCVSIFGHPVDADPLRQIAEGNDLILMEDAAQSNGSEYKGRKTGSLCDMTIFSFVAPKAMTSAGEGGMVTTNNDALAERLKLVRAFGWDREKCLASGMQRHDIIGWNSRMIGVQGAVGRIQLRKLDDFNQRRIDNARYLTERFGKLDGITPPYVSKDVKHVFWHYVVRGDWDMLGVSRDWFRKALLAEGVMNTIQYAMPGYRQPFLLEQRGIGDGPCPFQCPLYKGTVDYSKVHLPVVERACKEVLTLPVQNLLTKEQLKAVADAVEKVATYGHSSPSAAAAK
jgi:perosamine synthetase